MGRGGIKIDIIGYLSYKPKILDFYYFGGNIKMDIIRYL